jgi:repressor LexA
MVTNLRQSRKKQDNPPEVNLPPSNLIANSGKVSVLREVFEEVVKSSRREGRPKVNKLSERQKGILNFIKRFIYEENLPPTVREIQEELKITSTSVVDYNLKELVKKGYIQRGNPESERSIARGIQLTDEGWEYPTEFQVPRFRAVDIRPREVEFAPNLVPLYGVIAAGIPIPNRTDFDQESDRIEVPPSMLGKTPGDVFALRVKGQSMIDAFIADGDIVLIKAQQKAETGETVAVWLEQEQETTLKMWYPDPAKNVVELKPANETMKPIVTKLSNVRVMGKLVGVIRTMA